MSNRERLTAISPKGTVLFVTLDTRRHTKNMIPALGAWRLVERVSIQHSVKHVAPNGAATQPQLLLVSLMINDQ